MKNKRGPSQSRRLRETRRDSSPAKLCLSLWERCSSAHTGAERVTTPNSTLHTPHWLRVLVGILAPTLILLLCRWLLRGGGLLCLFHEITGLYCPGCGSGRATLALLRGHPLKALGHNPLLFLLGAPCGLLLVREYLRFVFPGLGLRALVLPAWAGETALGLFLAFWLLRNLPGFAFLGP